MGDRRHPSGGDTGMNATNDSADARHACGICRTGTIVEVPEYGLFRRVTSDCRPWPAGGRLAVCGNCGGVQKPADSAFLRDIEAIYDSYAIYHQGQGAEQAVFEPSSGLPASRSSRLLQTFRSRAGLGETGRMLDVGCGNGATLRAFGGLSPGWTLAGTELNDKYRREVESIPRTEPLHVCPADRVPGRFDVITMIHVLEHVLEPVEFLASLLPKLTPGGVVLIEVPHHPDNPFELLIADHRSHFSAATLGRALRDAGYDVLSVATDWIPKELSVIARAASGEPPRSSPDDPAGAATAAVGASSHRLVTDSLGWLRRTVEAARIAARSGPVGLFGTSIAGTWLAAELGASVGFFVDEDPARIGATYRGRAIRSPTQVPPGSTVFVGLPPAVAAGICRRLAAPGITYCAPPA
ncbi:MAG: methyltransferase domain-containing protein [Planctomycetia bacterium]|nr:methyltransferase domain-containing protein [Planctomycetia bacterium]